MNKITCIILAVVFGGCYTQLQLASKEGPSTTIYVPPDPIIIIIPQPIPCPFPVPTPHPVIVPPAVQTTAQVPAQEENRIRTSGSTRDKNGREQTGERRR